jgi:hypothetical protein
VMQNNRGGLCSQQIAAQIGNAVVSSHYKLAEKHRSDPNRNFGVGVPVVPLMEDRTKQSGAGRPRGVVALGARGSRRGGNLE